MEIIGKVVKGKGRGRDLGFPTANLDISSGSITSLEYGIYATFVSSDAFSQVQMGALSLGPAYTFGETKPTVEVYLLDFTGDLYGKVLRLDVVKKIRNMEKFDTVEKLVDQIKKDCDVVRVILNQKKICSVVS